jgi:hypothetical protein
MEANFRQNKLFLPTAERLYSKFSANTTETLKEFLMRRNTQLINLFKETGHSIKLTGKAEHPCIIVDGKFKLSAYAHNFNLIFKDRPFKGEEVLRVKINATNKIQAQFFETFINTVEQELIEQPKRSKRKRVVISKPQLVFQVK